MFVTESRKAAKPSKWVRLPYALPQRNRDFPKFHHKFITEATNQYRRDRFCTLYGARRFVIECPAPSTTIFLAMKNSIIFILALSLVAMMLASCNSVPSAFAPDETATTGVTRQTNETRPERSAEDSVNSISGGHY